MMDMIGAQKLGSETANCKCHTRIRTSQKWSSLAMRQSIDDKNEDKRRRRSSSYMDSKLRRSQAHPHQFGEPVCCICHHRLHSERIRKEEEEEKRSSKRDNSKITTDPPFSNNNAASWRTCRNQSDEAQQSDDVKKNSWRNRRTFRSLPRLLTPRRWCRRRVENGDSRHRADGVLCCSFLR